MVSCQPADQVWHSDYSSLFESYCMYCLHMPGGFGALLCVIVPERERERERERDPSTGYKTHSEVTRLAECCW